MGLYQTCERHLEAGRPIVKQPLIQQCQQGIEYSAIGFEDFVNECNVSRGQIAISLAQVLIIFQSFH